MVYTNRDKCQVVFKTVFDINALVFHFAIKNFKD